MCFAICSDATCTMFASAPAASASIPAIAFQVRTSSDVIWNVSPMAIGCPSRPTKAFAKSVLCVSVQRDVPSPCTTIGLPCRIRSIAVQPASSGMSVRS